MPQCRATQGPARSGVSSGLSSLSPNSSMLVHVEIAYQLLHLANGVEDLLVLHATPAFLMVVEATSAGWVNTEKTWQCCALQLLHFIKCLTSTDLAIIALPASNAHPVVDYSLHMPPLCCCCVLRADAGLFVAGHDSGSAAS